MGEQEVVKTYARMQKMYGPRSRKIGEETVVKISCLDKTKIVMLV